jgi:hypothetical protein
MSIRKYFPLDFPKFIEALKEQGFEYIERYRKAEALVGDSNSIDFIDLYFKNDEAQSIMQEFGGQYYRNFFLDIVLEERKFNKLLESLRCARLEMRIHIEYYDSLIKEKLAADKVSELQWINTHKDENDPTMQ